MTWSYVLINPPYSGSIHLDFLKKGYEILSDKGQMIIIEPATWLIDIRKYGKRGEEMRVNSSVIKKYDELKKMLEGQVKKVIIENYNKEFNVGLYTPFSISHIDKTYNSNIIKCKICGEQKILTSLYDCNLNGNYDLIWSILNKISTHDKVKNHIYIPNKSKKLDNKYYIPFSEICAVTPIAVQSIRPNSSRTDARFYNTNNGDFYKLWFHVLFHASYEISSTVPKMFARGGSTTNKKKFSDKDATCIMGTKEELENWKHFVFNNTLPLFINIVMTIDQNNNSLDYVPWLVDKKYTDEEIYKIFNFTEEEIKLIETTIKKYQRHSPWFKRYMCGPSEVTDEEVQKFIEDLNK